MNTVNGYLISTYNDLYRCVHPSRDKNTEIENKISLLNLGSYRHIIKLYTLVKTLNRFICKVVQA